MADGKTYIVPTKDEPTFWNKEAFMGTFLLPIPVVGTVVGGLVGKARMEREKEYGKPIDPPSFWNKTTYIGGVVGVFAAVAVGVVATLTLGPIGLVAAAATAIGGIVAGGYMGKERIRKEYDAAEALVNARDQMNVAEGKAPGHSPSPDLAKKLASGINGITYVGALAGAAVGGTLATLTGGAAAPAVIMLSEIGGAIGGGLIGKGQQEHRYERGDVVTRDEALLVEVSQRGLRSAPQRGQQISMEEAKLLETRLAQVQEQASAQDRVTQMRDAPSQLGM